MVSRAGAGDRSDPCARQTNGNIGVADHGIEPGKAISELPPGTEPGQVVGSADQLSAAGYVDYHLRIARADPHGIG